MALAHGLAGIIRIESGCTHGTEIHKVAHLCRLYRLSAAVDTAARTTHDLDEIIVLFAALDALQYLAGIGKTAGNCHMQFQIADLVGGFLMGATPRTSSKLSFSSHRR